MRSTLAALTLAVGLAFPPPGAQAQWTTNGVALCATANDQLFPTITSDGAGGAIVTWQDGIGTGDIYARRVDAAGVPLWATNGVALSTATGDQTEPKVVSDGAGGAIVAWNDTRGGGALDIYARRVDASGTPLWTANGVALTTATGDQVLTGIVSDGAGGAIVTWHDNRSGTGYDIYAQRVDASGTPLWTADGLALTTATNNQSLPAIASDGAGGAIVAWEDTRTGASDIYAQRVSALGVPQWTADGVAVCAASGGQISAAITSDEAGGAVVVWVDGRSGARGAYVQRISSLGVPQWTAGGVVLSSVGTLLPLAPRIVSDGTGGAIVTWADLRNGANYDIFARRVNASGVAQWTANGIAVCTAAGDQYFPTPLPDGAGGAIITWSDVRSGSLSDIYVQRVDTAGTVQWTADGVALTSAGDGIGPMMASDGAGGVIVAWYDYRSGNGSDIYAQHVNASGGVPTSVPGPAPGTASLAGGIYPNPFHGSATLSLQLTRPSAIRVEVFDIAGRTLRTMTRRDAVGSQRIRLDGRDDRGRLLPSGVYLCRVSAEGRAVTRKMVIAR